MEHGRSLRGALGIPPASECLASGLNTFDANLRAQYTLNLLTLNSLCYHKQLAGQILLARTYPYWVGIGSQAILRQENPPAAEIVYP